MRSESKNRNGEGAQGQGIPATAKKVVQSLKEIVNCAEQEIYAVLKECDMDPDRAVETLLAQDTFQEMKEVLDSRSGGSNVRLNNGGNTGKEQNVVQIGSMRVTYNEFGKATDKRERGSVCPSVTSSTIHVTGENTNSDSFITDSRRRSLGTGDSISVSAQVSAGLQTPWLGVRKEHLSMADIVRMGRPSQDALLHYHCKASEASASGKLESSSSHSCQSHSEQPVFCNKGPVIEQLMTDNSQTFMPASSNANEPPEHPSMNDTAVNLRKNCELDAAQVSQMDVAIDNIISDKIESASISSNDNITTNAGLGSHSNYNLKNTGSSDFQSSHDHYKDVSSSASDFQQLRIRDSELEVSSSEDNCTVVLPNHLQALAAECSNLSFGTYNGGSNSSSSAMLASNISASGLEEKTAAVYGSSAQYLDASSVNHGDEQPGFNVLRETTGDKNYAFLSSPQQEVGKRFLPEAILGHEYNTVPFVPDPSFQKSQWVTPSLSFNGPRLQGENLFKFPRETAYSNLMPGDVSAFLKSQSQLARYNNAVSSIGNSAISMSEILKPGAVAVPHRLALPQDLVAQSSTHLEQLVDTRSLPQNQPYPKAINLQQAFYGDTAHKYNQSSADINYNLPQHRNEFLMARLPPARDAIGNGNLGSPFYNPGSFLSNPSLGHMPSSNFPAILPYQHHGADNLSSIQQHGGFSPWDYGAESRSSFHPESTCYSVLGQPRQAPLLYVRPGYSNLYPSQTGAVEERQRSGDFQDLSSKQSHIFW